jgi:flagellar L-ring protein precursor FlgH
MRIPSPRPFSLCLLSLLAFSSLAKKPDKRARPSEIDQYIEEAQRRGATQNAGASAGSLWYPGALLTDLGRDPKARQVDDLVTILVAERATAAAKGTTKTGRKSSAQYSVSALAGITRAAGPWANLANLSGSSDLDGQGATTRESTLTATLAARVTHVLPNGYLVVEGVKNLTVNSENQVITVRGVVRPTDLTPANVVRSDRLAQLEVRINGKGIVGDAVRRPFFLYRLLLGLLPF